MNKIFKVLWDATSQQFVVTSELGKSKGKTKSVKTALVTAVGVATLATSAQAAMYATTVIDGVAGQLDAHAGVASVAIGSALPYTNAQGETSTTRASAPLAIAIGLGATAAKSATLPADSTNPTNPNFADPLAAVAIGASSVASGYTSVAYGYRARATDRTAVAVGPDARAAGYASTAIGNGSYAKDMSTTALGNYAYAEGFQAVAVGASRHAEGLKATGTQAILLGTSDNADLTQAELMGPGYADGANPWSEYTGTDLGTAQPTVAESRSSLVSGKNALGIGVAVKSTGDQAIAQGYYANASSKDSIAIGTLTKTGVDAVDSVAVGPRSNITSAKSNAFGSVNTITGANSTAIGNNNVIASEKVMVLGNNVTVATGFNSSVVLGDSSAVKAAVAVANYTYAGTIYNFAGAKPTSVVSVGDAGAERQIVNVAAGQISNTSTDAINGSQLYVIANAIDQKLGGSYFHTNNITNAGTGNATTNLGYITDAAGATGNYAVTAGVNATAKSQNAIAIGNGTTAGFGAIPGYGVNAIAIGQNATAQASDTIVIGTNATIATKLTDAADTYSVPIQAISIGADSSANALNATALGAHATAGQNFLNGNGTTSVGAHSSALFDRASAFGYLANASANEATALGSQANASSYATTAVGFDTKASKDFATAFGHSADALARSSTAMGPNTTVTADATAGIAIGVSSNVSATYGTALGARANVTAAAVNATAIGRLAQADHAEAVALGSNSITREATKENTATVNGVTYSGFAGNAPKSVVSFGKAGEERQLVNVAAGKISATSTDAINGSQLYMVANQVGNLTTLVSNFTTTPVTTNSTTGIVNTPTNPNATVKAGDIVTAINQSGWTAAVDKTGTGVSTDKGGDKLVNPGDTVTFIAGNNMNIIKDGLNYTIATNENVTFTNVNASTVNVGPVTINNSGINAGNTTITNVSAGVNATDAVNVQQLNNAFNNITTVNSWSITGNNNAENATVVGNQTVSFNNGTGTVAVVDGTNVVYNVDFGKLTANSSTGVAEGDISSTKVASTQDVVNAINGSGWKTTNSDGTTSVINPGDTVNYVNGTNTVANVNTVDGTTTVSFDAQTTDLNVNENGTIDAPTAENGSSLVNATTLVKAVNNVSWNVNSTKVEGSVKSSVKGDTTASKVKAGDTVNINAGNNIEITRNGNTVAVATSMTPTFTSVQVGGETGPVISSDDEGNVKIAKADGKSPAKITNVAAGTADNDAVNVGQLKGVTNNLNNKIDNVDQRASRGIAVAGAIGMLPQPHISGKSMVAASTTNYRGEQAVAVGYSRLSDNGKHIIKLSGSSNLAGKKDAMVGASYGYQW